MRGAELTDRRLLMAAALLLAAGAEAQQPPLPLPPPGIDGMFGVVRQSLTLWGIWDYVVFFAVAGLPVYCCCLWMLWCLCCWCWHRRGRQFAREAQRRFSYDHYRKPAKSRREHGAADGRRRRHDDTRRRGGGDGGRDGDGAASRRQPDDRDDRHAQEGGPRPNAAADAKPRPPSGWAAIPVMAGLPPGWEELIDDGSGDTYYHHIASGATSWERPG